MRMQTQTWKHNTLSLFMLLCLNKTDLLMRKLVISQQQGTMPNTLPGWNTWHFQLPAHYFSFAVISLELTACIYSIAYKYTLSVNPQLLTVIIINNKRSWNVFPWNTDIYLWLGKRLISNYSLWLSAILGFFFGSMIRFVFSTLFQNL